MCTTRIANKPKCVYYKVREIAGSYIKFRNIQVSGISKYEVRGRKKRPQTTRFETRPDGGVGYKVVQSTRIEKVSVRILNDETQTEYTVQSTRLCVVQG